MKRKNKLAAALIATVSASAGAQLANVQTNVEVYGVLDGGISRVTGLAGGSQNAVVSGIMDGSRLGFRGNEDLGGGYRALFTMEHRLELDNGTVSNRPPTGAQLPDRLAFSPLLLRGLPSVQQTALQPVVTSVGTQLGSQVGVNVNNAFWDRQIFVGLVTPVGAVLAGRQYTPAYETSAIFDTLGTQSSLAAGQVASLPAAVDIRVSNALAYRIQKGPMSGALMYAAGENGSGTGRLVGGNVMYKTDRFAVGLGGNSRKNELGQKSLTSVILGGSVNVGPGTVVSSLGAIKDDNPTGLSPIAAQLTPVVGAATAGVVQNAFIEGLRQDSRILHLGYRMTLGRHTTYVAATGLDDRRPANADVVSYGTAYTFAFSKRTDLNAVLTRFDNKNLAQAAPGQAGSLGGVTASAGKDSTSLSLGVRHRF